MVYWNGYIGQVVEICIELAEQISRPKATGADCEQKIRIQESLIRYYKYMYLLNMVQRIYKVQTRLNDNTNNTNERNIIFICFFLKKKLLLFVYCF